MKRKTFIDFQSIITDCFIENTEVIKEIKNENQYKEDEEVFVIKKLNNNKQNLLLLSSLFLKEKEKLKEKIFPKMKYNNYEKEKYNRDYTTFNRDKQYSNS